MKLRIFTYIFLLFITGSVVAQTPELDSMIQLIPTSAPDTNKVKLLNKIATKLQSSDQNEAERYTQLSESLAKSLNYRRGLADALKIRGNINYFRTEYDKAMDLYRQGLAIAEADSIKDLTASISENLGNVYYQQGIYKQAMEAYVKSLRMREALNDRKSIAKSYSSLGLVYMKMDTSENGKNKAIEYFTKGSELSKEFNDIPRIMNFYQYLGLAYQDKRNYDSATVFFNSFLELAEEVNSKLHIARAYESIASNIYRKNRKIKTVIVNGSAFSNEYLNDSDSKIIIDYNQRALDIYEEINNKVGIANCYLAIGSAYNNSNKFQQAYIYVKKGLDIAEQQNIAEAKLLGYSLYSSVNANLKNYKDSYYNLILYNSLNDSLKGKENARNATRMEMQYQFDKERERTELEQKQRDELQQAELKRQKQFTYSLMGGILLMILLLAVVIHNYRQQQKAKRLLEAQKLEIEKQRDEIEKQRDIATAQRDEIHRQKEEITDSIMYAKRIQTAVLPPAEFMKAVFPEHFILFRPRDIVSGDFYWATLNKTKAVIAAADCTGHGVPGAFMSMLGMSFLNEIVNKEDIIHSDEILNRLRANVKRSLRQTGKEHEAKDGMDISLCVIDIETHELQFSGAYNPGYVFRGTEIIELKADKMPIGIQLREKDAFSRTDLQLIKGDTIYLLSDGFVDQFGGERGRKFMIKGFKDMMINNQDKGMTEQLYMLNDAIEDWMAHVNPKSGETYHQIDDIMVIGLRVS